MNYRQLHEQSVLRTSTTAFSDLRSGLALSGCEAPCRNRSAELTAEASSEDFLYECFSGDLDSTLVSCVFQETLTDVSSRQRALRVPKLQYIEMSRDFV